MPIDTANAGRAKKDLRPPNDAYRPGYENGPSFVARRHYFGQKERGT
jgi:hypothetical protein